VLQNDKYIAFADDNTVEVLALGSIPSQLDDPKDRRTETYDGKDENGKPVKYMKEFAGCTADQLNALNSSPAGQYNKTGRIPYLSIVDPYTLQEIKQMPGGAATKGLMESVLEAKDTLKSHGASMKRSTLQKLDAAVTEVTTTLDKSGPAAAMPGLLKFEAATAKESDSIKAKAAALREKILDAAKAQLDDAEAKIAAGDLKGAATIVKPLVSALKGTDLARRAAELMEKTKPAPDAK
jgi:hypothetical protein